VTKGIVAASHVHSVWSYDGQWKLDEIVREFSGRGYQVLMMTEHDRGFTESRWADYREACRELSSEKQTYSHDASLAVTRDLNNVSVSIGLALETTG
jgi:histidinol phosphatase-like PHP family hydrolase